MFSSLDAEPFYFNPRAPNRPPTLGVMPSLELPDSAGPTPLGMGMPTDPDGDPLTVRFTGVPRYGEVQIEGRKVQPDAIMPAEKLSLVTYKPELGRNGAAGTLDILVEDGRGGAVVGSIGITVIPSNHPPVVERPRRVRMYVGTIGITRPEHPDGFPMVVTIGRCLEASCATEIRRSAPGINFRPKRFRASSSCRSRATSAAPGCSRTRSLTRAAAPPIVPSRSTSLMWRKRPARWPKPRYGSACAARAARRTLTPSIVYTRIPNSLRPLCSVGPSWPAPANHRQRRFPAHSPKPRK